MFQKIETYTVHGYTFFVLVLAEKIRVGTKKNKNEKKKKEYPPLKWVVPTVTNVYSCTVFVSCNERIALTQGQGMDRLL